MSGPTLTLSLAEYNTLIADRDTAQLEAAALRQDIVKARMTDPTETVAKVTAFARDCLTVAQFAVANLPPDTNRGWPYEALTRICESINVLPDYSFNDRDMAIDLLHFARDCREAELRWKSEVKPATRFTPEELAAKRAELEEHPAQLLLKHIGK